MALPWVQFRLPSRPVVLYPPEIVRQVRLGFSRTHPDGWKGGALRRVWRAYRGTAPGVVTLDPDVAVDPRIMAAMEKAVVRDSSIGWAVPYRQWGLPTPPKDFTLPDETVADPEKMRLIGMHLRETPGAYLDPDGATLHYAGRPFGSFIHGAPDASGGARWGSANDDELLWAGYGCTYLPMGLLERCELLRINGRMAWESLVFPHADRILWGAIAYAAPRIGLRMVPGVEAVHVHMWPESLGMAMDEL